MQFEAIASKGQVVPLLFSQHSVAANQTDQKLNILETSNTTLLQVQKISMPFAGSIVGISVDLSAAASAGQLTVGAAVNGTEKAASTQTITTQTGKVAVFDRDAIKFVAGDYIGAEITTNAGWNGTSSDLAVHVYVLFEVSGI